MFGENAVAKGVCECLGIPKGEISIYYQPILGLQDGALVGAEALVRLSLEDGKVLGPADFIQDVEAAGLDTVLDHWVLAAACRQQVAWLAEGLGPPIVSVNIRPGQARQPDFLDMLRTIIAEAGIQPSRLQIEVSEVAFAQGEEGAALVHQLKLMGVKVALDGFSKGYWDCVN